MNKNKQNKRLRAKLINRDIETNNFDDFEYWNWLVKITI